MTKRLLITMGLAIALGAQTPGTVTTQTVVTITAVAGTAPSVVQCTFAANAITGLINVNCTAGGATLNSTLPLPMPSPGTVGNFGLSSNTVTWAFVPFNAPNASAICPTGTTAGTCWQVVANGTTKNGSF